MNSTFAIPSIAAIGALIALTPIAATPNGSAASAAAAYTDAPVVLTGADLPTLAGNAPGEIVAWRYSGGWQQIPMQIDERAVVDYATIYKNSTMTGVTALVYTDATTWTGADADATFDTNDELVFMARDAGQRPAVWADPPHVVAGTAREVRVNDPLDAQNTTYVYLFEQDGTLDQAAGASYVSYSFALNGGAYKSVYTNPMGSVGPNLESSKVVGQTYQTHFTDRWVNDELQLIGTNGTSADLLDRHKVLFAPGNCTRSENTFSNGVSPYPIGAFIANKNGPVRAIRSYVGANSGPLTQRDHFFYSQHQEMRTSLRVHSVPGIMDFFDWNDQAVGMTYANSNNTAGVSIDGVEETITAGDLAWAMISGTPGSIIESYAVESDIAGLQPTSYYLDDATPSTTQCTGDSKAIGSAGVWINQTIPCTDPLPASFGGTCPSSYKTLKLRRSMHYSGQVTTAGAAADYAAADALPPSASVGAWVAPTATPSATPTTPSATPTTPSATPTTPSATPTTPSATPATPSATPATPSATPEITATPSTVPETPAYSIYLPLIVAP